MTGVQTCALPIWDCYVCKGARLKPAVLAVTVHDLNIVDVCDLSVDDALDLFNKLNLTEQEMSIARLILKEIKSRLTFMSNVGLNYLELSRAVNTLSGGEAQRIRLATQIGAGLQGVLYVLNERPSRSTPARPPAAGVSSTARSSRCCATPTPAGSLDNLFDKYYYASSHDVFWINPGAPRTITLGV